MTELEVKRKELETAKKIRDAGYDCANDKSIDCKECTLDLYPLCTEGKEVVDDFIATREAELAELDKEGSTTPERLYPRAKGATGPTVDDFALALIQGGYYPLRNEDTAALLYARAVELKAESERRRKE